MSYTVEPQGGWPHKARTYQTMIEAQRALLRRSRLWPAIKYRVVCTGIGKEG